jgi:hypothetical protein
MNKEISAPAPSDMKIKVVAPRLLPTPAHQRVVELKRHHLKLVMVAWVR